MMLITCSQRPSTQLSSKDSLEDTETSFSADEEFLMMLKEKCSTTDAEWEQRLF